MVVVPHSGIVCVFFFFLLIQTIPPLYMVVWSAALLVSLTSVNSHLTPMLCEKVILARPRFQPSFSELPSAPERGSLVKLPVAAHRKHLQRFPTSPSVSPDPLIVYQLPPITTPYIYFGCCSQLVDAKHL